MGFWSNMLTPGVGVNSVAESVATSPDHQPERHGYEFGVPMGGTKTATQAYTHSGDRRMALNEQFSAYMACSWVSTCVDTISRLVTAGGIELVPTTGDPDQNRPANIDQLDALMRWTNERQDLIQVCRCIVQDLLVAGDGFLEIGWQGDYPMAMWTLDAATVSIRTDEHGSLYGYVQSMDENNRVTEFDRHEVVHVALDAPRGSVYGVSPVQKLMVSITAWLFTTASLKEFYRRGAPPTIAVDLGRSTSEAQAQKWSEEYQTKLLGPRTQGIPIVTRVHTASTDRPPIMELSQRKVTEMLEALRQLRDEIISGFGMTPSNVGVIESGHIGSGTGDSQARTLQYGTIIPIQNLILEKLTFALLTQRGIDGWEFRFKEVDFRDSKIVEDIRDMRLRTGAWTLNKYRSEIGEGPVDGGDEPILVDRSGVSIWSQMLEGAEVAMNAAKADAKASTFGQKPPNMGNTSSVKMPNAESWLESFSQLRAEALAELGERRDDS